MAQEKYDVFISYSRKDHEQVVAFKKEIEATTMASCWMDLEGIESGNPKFTQAIITAINECPIFLFMLSEASQQSENAQKELDFAYGKHREEGKKVAIVYIKPCQMSDEFRFDYGKADTIDWQNPLQREKLIRDLKTWTKKEYKGRKEDGEREEKQISKWQNIQEIFSKNRKGCTITLSVCLMAIFVVILLPYMVFWRWRDQNIVLPIELPSSSSMASPSLTITDTICTPVDLGLPSGTLWADRNVGARTPSDYGDLYAWGEVSIKRDYSQGTYSLQDKPMNKIATIQHDAATAILGDEWCMPSEEQMQELLEECEWKWTQSEGHKGYELKGKNGNTIFLPAAGWICSTQPDYQNMYGYYWTANRTISNSQFARSLQFPKNGKGIIGNGYLYYGRSIRAIYQGMAFAD